MRPDSWISVKLSPGAPLNNEAGLVIVRLELLGPKNKNKRKATSYKRQAPSYENFSCYYGWARPGGWARPIYINRHPQPPAKYIRFCGIVQVTLCYRMLQE